jgi:ribosomal protein S18 acetylase RimI-like enzyme
LIEIRNYDKSNRDGIINVCIQTGYMGEDARIHFDDHYLFSQLFCLYYVDYEPENCFVAIDDTNETVVGYTLSSLNTKTQQSVFRRKMIPKILIRIIFYSSWRYRRSFNIIRYMRQVESRSDNSLTQNLVEEYPAHLHINILPQYHRQGIGSRLIECLEDHLRSNNSKGVHLLTSDRNMKAVPFYKKMGFNLLYSSPLGYGIWPNVADVKTLIFGKKITTEE